MRRFLLATVAISALLTAEPARADPFLTPLLVTAGITGSIEVAGTSIALASIVSYTLTAGATLALSSLLAPTPNQKVNPQTYQTKQSLPPLIYGYGIVRLGGAKFFFENVAGALLNGVIHCEGPIDGFEQWILNDAFTGLSKDAQAWAPDGYGGTNVTPPWRNNVLLESRRGTPDQSASSIFQTYGGTKWGPDFRLAGKVYTPLVAKPVKKEKFTTYYPNGSPDPFITARMARLYDPRNSAMVAATSEQPSWLFSQNCSLAVLHYLTAIRGIDAITGKPVPYGFGLPLSRIDMASFAAFADVCDQAVQKKDGTAESRYTIGGTFDMGNERRADVLAKLLATCDGELHQTPDGKIAIRGGLWTAPTVTISDQHILSYEFDNGAGKLATFNRLKITFTDPFNNFQQIEADPWDDLAAQALSGEVVSQDLTVGMVTTPSQARRLAKIAMAKANPKNRLTITTDLYGLLCIDQRIITLQIAELGINGTFLITAFTENGDGATCKIGLSTLDASAYAWDPASEEGTAPARPSIQAQPVDIPNVTNEALSVVRVTGGGPVTTLTIQASADAPTNPGFELHGQIRQQGQDDTAWQPMALQSDGSVMAGDRNDGVTYEVQLAFWSAYGGTQGPWTASQFVTATADTTSTGPATGFVANGGSGQSMLAWTAPNAGNFGSSQVRRVNGRSSAATPPAGAVTVVVQQGSPNQSFDIVDAPSTGLFTYWVVSLNRSGYFDATSTTPPQTVTVT